MTYPELLYAVQTEKVIGCLTNILIVTKVTPWPFAALTRPFWREISGRLPATTFHFSTLKWHRNYSKHHTKTPSSLNDAPRFLLPNAQLQSSCMFENIFYTISKAVQWYFSFSLDKFWSVK
jgi:hypothetical protein